MEGIYIWSAVSFVLGFAGVIWVAFQLRRNLFKDARPETPMPIKTQKPTWGDYVRVYFCWECSHKRGESFSICPKCGSEGSRPGVGRWKYKGGRNMFIGGDRTVDFEERKEKLNKPAS